MTIKKMTIKKETIKDDKTKEREVSTCSIAVVLGSRKIKPTIQ